MKKLLALFLLGLVTWLSGCASVNKQATQVFPKPEQGKGLVYFFREKKFVGAAISYNVKENGAVIGAIANGTYFFVQATPGSHSYTASTEADSTRTVQVEEGKTYYIACGVEMGVFAGRPALKVVTEEEANLVLPTLTYATK